MDVIRAGIISRGSGSAGLSGTCGSLVDNSWHPAQTAQKRVAWTSAFQQPTHNALQMIEYTNRKRKFITLKCHGFIKL